jgi:GNAT superfamily N-acetyltransferase
MCEVSYRLATPADIETLVQLRVAFLAEAMPEGSPVPTLAEGIRAYFGTSVPAGDFVASLAIAEGACIGVSGLVLHRHPPRLKNPAGLSGYILNVYVVPAFRRRHIATKLVALLAEHARAAGCTYLNLHALPGRQAVYLKLGFIPKDTEYVLQL